MDLTLPHETARLRFRRWGPEDYPLAELLWGDPAVTRHVGGPFDSARIRRRFERQFEHEQAAGVQYWQLWLKQGGDFVGCCGLRPPEAGRYEHGFYLRPGLQGQGLAFEAASTVLRHAFTVLGAASVWAAHFAGNAGSRALLLKLGLRHIQTLELPPPQPDDLIYELSAEQWLAAQKGTPAD